MAKDPKCGMALEPQTVTAGTDDEEHAGLRDMTKRFWIGSTSFIMPTPARSGGLADAETTPLRHPEYYQYDLNLADIAEVWHRGSVIASWLLDLTALALLGSQDLADFKGRVSDSGEGRWTVMAAIDESAPAPVISAALYDRFSSRGEAVSPTRCSLRCVTRSAVTWKGAAPKGDA